jgi:hypothetical protein
VIALKKLSSSVIAVTRRPQTTEAARKGLRHEETVWDL